MSLSIDLYANDGSPLGITPDDIYGRGVGGAELAMMSWAETMCSRGHTVRVYNNPVNPGFYNGVEYLPQDAFEPSTKRDVFVIYRSPNPFVRLAKAEVKLFWSCDQYTSGNFRTDVFPFVDRSICISPFHVSYHKKRYGVADDKIGYFDLGVRLQDYEQEIEKVAGKCIFCSVPDRGLEVLRLLWPRIKEKVPFASLVITSDYRLWGAANPLNQEHRMKWLYEKDVSFLGKVPRMEMVRHQLEAEVLTYPCTYDELFCISAAECQVAGCLPVTTTIGALETTNIFGGLKGNPVTKQWQDSFVETIVCFLKGVSEIPEQPLLIKNMQKKAKERFNWQTICQQWEHLIETGEYATKTNANNTNKKRASISTNNSGRKKHLAATT